MKKFGSKLISLFVVLSSAYLTQAYDDCGYYNGKYWYCYDGYYCCGFSYGNALCCEYAAIYTMWYFWLGISLGISLLSFTCAMLRRVYIRRRIERATAQRITQDSNCTVGVQNPNYHENVTQVTVVSPPYPDQPPVYETVQPSSGYGK